MSRLDPHRIPEIPGAGADTGRHSVLRGRIVVAGGTGFIGRPLVERLVALGHEVVVLTRHPRAASPDGHLRFALWDACTEGEWHREVDGAYAVVNLAGESLAGLWTARRRRSIRESRVNAGAALSRAVVAASVPPSLLVQASAVGFYGDRGEERLDETSAAGAGFLSSVVRAWEESTIPVCERGVRRVVMRLGIVVGKGGFVSRVAVPFRLFLGGTVGGGAQWFPWVHAGDVVKAVQFFLSHGTATGVFNVTSPKPIRHGEFARALGEALRRPVWLPVPAFLVRRAVGAMGTELLLASQRVYPQRLVQEGFSFYYSNIRIALSSVL